MALWAVARFATLLHSAQSVWYSSIGKNKYEVLGWDYRLKDTPLNTKEQLERAKRLFDEYFSCAVLN